MKYSLLVALLLSNTLLFANEQIVEENFEEISKPTCDCQLQRRGGCDCDGERVLNPYYDMRVNVKGQGVSPVDTVSPAQAYALAKRAAIADAYRLLAEKLKGVRIEGEDTIKNMMVKRSTVRTYVDAMIRNANILETNFEEGLCEVEMEVTLSYSQFAH